MAKDDFKVKKGLVVGKGIVADSAVTASAFIGDGSQLTNLDYNDISSNLPTILDSAAVNSLITVADTHDSAAVVGQIDSDYIELRRPAESVLAVVNNGSGAYRYSGDGFPLQSGNNPSLYLTRGKTYKFAVNASGHPFWIQTSSGAYNSGNVLSDSDGVTNNGQQSGNVFYTVPMTAPTQLYYVCQYHSSMNGNIYIDKVVGVDSAAVQAQFDSNFNDTITITKNSTTDPALKLQTTADGSSAAPIMEFIRNTSQANNGDYLGQIKFRGEDSGGSATTDIYAKMTGKISDATDGTEDGLIEYAVKSGGSNKIIARMTGGGGGSLDILNGANVDVTGGGNVTVSGNNVLTTASTYVQSVTAGSGIKSISSASTPTVTVDSGFVTGLFSASEGISYSGGVIGLDATDSATFANVTVTNEFAVFDSANGEEVAKFAGDPSTGLTIHSHAHATDGGIRFVIHNTADSDYLILSQPTGISAVNRRIRNVGAPTSDKDAATKSYVDGVAQGLAIRDPAKAATTAALTSTNDITAFAYDSGALGFGAKILITATTGLDSVDGYTLQSGDRLMVKNETGNNLPFNGIYNWDSAKGLTRTTDMDSGSEFNGGEFVFVQEGTINGGNGFSQKDNVTTLGQDAVHFVQFSGAGQITAGNGIAKAGNTLSVDVASSSGLTGTGGGGSQLSIDLEGTSLELTSGGIRVSQQGSQGIGLQELNLENGGITLAAIAAGDASETFATAALRNQLESGIYKVYTSAIGDSDTRALVDSDYVRLRADSDYIKTVTGFANGNLTNSTVTVTAGKGLLNGGSVALGSSVTLNIDSANIQGFIDSAYIRPLARAAIVAGSNITYDSATGVVASTASGGSGTSSSFTVALGLLDSTSRAGTDITSALGVGDPVFYDSNAGYWTGAKADSASTASHVIVEFSTSNSNFKIAQTGVFTLDSNSGSPTFVDNSYYYLSDSSGVPTPTQPTLGVFQALYYALDSDTIDINLGDPVELSLGKTDIEQFPNVVGGNTTLSLTQAINTARTDVYKNGILLQEGATSDYVISSSTQITLNDAPDDSDLFSVRSMVTVGTVNTATTVITGSTAGAPNPAVQGDTNTGLFSAAADTLSITTGGSERLKATNSGVEVTGTLTASTTNISGELTMTGGPGIPKNTSLTDAATINFNIDSGNTGTLSFDSNRTLVVGVTGGASMAPYVGTSFTILAFNSDANSDKTLTVQAASGDTLHFSSTNVVTVSAQKMSIISGMVFDADDVVLSSVSLDSSLTF
tara:strand:- start:4101 stop:7889 length:3789 start_codon:yes stop_codon:yes gene_type:complete